MSELGFRDFRVRLYGDGGADSGYGRADAACFGEEKTDL